MPSIPERKEAKLAGGVTRREQYISKSDFQLVDTARQKQGATDSIWDSVFRDWEECAALRTLCCITDHSNHPLFL